MIFVPDISVHKIRKLIILFNIPVTNPFCLDQNQSKSMSKKPFHHHTVQLWRLNASYIIEVYTGKSTLCKRFIGDYTTDKSSFLSVTAHHTSTGLGLINNISQMNIKSGWKLKKIFKMPLIFSDPCMYIWQWDPTQ